MEVTIIDFNDSLCRIDKRRVEFILFSRLPIDHDRQVDVNIPKTRAEQLLCWIVERRRLTIITKLTLSCVKEVNRERKVATRLHEFDKTFEAHWVSIADERTIQFVQITVVVR